MLPDAIGSGSSVEDIFRQIPDASGNLVKLMWFLESTGLLHREKRVPDAVIDEQLPPCGGGGSASIATQAVGTTEASNPRSANPNPLRRQRPA